MVLSTSIEERRANANGGRLRCVVTGTPECIVVCIGPGPGSSRLVHATARLAESMKARWCALHVSIATAPPLSRADRDRVEAHLALAESLGAEVSYVVARTVVDGVLDHARECGATRIVAGKPTHSRWRDWWRGGLLETLIRRSGDIEIHVLAPSEDVAPRPRQHATPRWRAYVQVAVAIVTVTAIGVAVRERLSLPDQAMLYLAAIMIAALAGRGAGMLAALLSVALFNFFFIPPYHTFAVSDLDHLLTFVVMFLVGTAMGTLVARLRDAQTASLQRERRTSALLALSSQTAAAESIEDVAAAVVEQVERVLGAPAAVLVPTERDELQAVAGLGPLAAPEIAVARWAHEHRRTAGRGTETYSDARLLAVPLWVGTESAGVVAVELQSARRRIDLDARVLLEAMARQAGVAIARLTLARDAREAELRARAEELRSSLLSTVSHDLRTPLAVITGMATTLRTTSSNLSPDQTESLDTIVDEAARLGAILHNLLAITRVESGAELRRDWVPIEELIGSALGRLDHALARHDVCLDVASDAYALVDPILFEQVLINLLENAAKHTPAGTRIDVAVRQEGSDLLIEIADRGGGLPANASTRLFEKFYRGPGVRGAGAGLGLAVCRGIVLAHGGHIEAENRPGGGARFRVRIAGGTSPVPELTDPLAPQLEAS